MENSNNNRRNGSNSTGDFGSWLAVIIAMCVFWPLGVFLLIKKLGSYTKEQNHAKPVNNAGAYTYKYKHTNAANVRREGAEFKDSKGGKAKSRRSRLEKKSGRFASTILLLVSIMLLLVGGSTIADAIGILADGGAGLSTLAMGIFYFIGGLISFFARNIGTKRISRYKKFNALIGERLIVPVSDIAAAAGVTEKAAQRDIQAMIDAGYLGAEAYIDVGLGAVVLSAEAAQKARADARKASEKRKPQPGEKPSNQYMAIINELRELNVTIADIPISDKIDRIEALTAKIFRIVEENPGKLPQIRRFMNYYLPTTLKLLHSYATLEKQGILGENITAAKQNIGDILDKLATGFEQQLDLLFKDDAIDISADINVLEKMMRQDGLSGDGQEFKTMESGGF